MKTNFKCPICSGSEWHRYRKYIYKKNNYTYPLNLNNSRVKYIAMRHHILSYLWFADSDEIELTSLLCNKCGFMCYTPRPTAIDLDTKYNFLNGIEKIGAMNSPNIRGFQIIEKRAFRLYSIIEKYKKGKTFNVLDYGGGDGSLLKHFVAKDIACYLVDFNQQPIPGVKRLGSTINDLSLDLLFDVIICSHVLEHVVDPVELLKQLRPFLRDNGIIYIEVPIEVWKDIPLQYDPVTHINFFTKESLQTAVHESHYKSEKIKYDYQPYGNIYKRVAWAIITKNNKPSDVFYKPEKTIQLLNPGLVKKIIRSLENIWINRFLNNSKILL